MREAYIKKCTDSLTKWTVCCSARALAHARERMTMGNAGANIARDRAIGSRKSIFTPYGLGLFTPERSEFFVFIMHDN